MAVRILLIIHALLGLGSLALTVHLFLGCLSGVRGRALPRPSRRFAVLSCVFVTLTILTGALIYPAFRVHVRAAWMDDSAPHLTGLFEIKEHWAALALPLSIAICLRIRSWGRRGGVSPAWRGMAFLAGLLMLIVCYNALVGLWLVAERSV